MEINPFSFLFTGGLLRFFHCSFYILVYLLITTPVGKTNPIDYRYQKAFKVQNLSITDGLSQSVIKAVIQDQDGYIWLGSEDGLNRYDSYGFTVFRHDFDDPSSLHENWVISLHEDPGNGIWVGTVAGLSYYNVKTKKFTDISAIFPQMRTYIWKMLYTDDGRFWVATTNGLFVKEKDEQDFKLFRSSADNSISIRADAMVEHKQFLYVSGNDCLHRITKSTNHMVNLCDTTALSAIDRQSITVLNFQKDILWLGTIDGLFRYDEKNDSLTAYYNDSANANSLSSNYVQDIAVDRAGKVWVATTLGLDFYDQEKSIFQHYQQQEYSAEGLSSNDVLTLMVDNQGLIWLGTYGGGVDILNPNPNQFEHLLTKGDVRKLGRNNTIHGIEKDQHHRMWFASFGGGLISFDLLTGEIDRPFNDESSFSPYVYALTIDYQHRLWVGTLDAMEVIDLDNDQKLDLDVYIDGKRQESFLNVKKIYQDHKGDLWFAATAGFYKQKSIEQSNGKLVLHITDLTPNMPSSFVDYERTVSTIVGDQNGHIWLGGVAGLLRYNPESFDWYHFKFDKNNPQSLSNDNVQVIYEDSHGFLWVGTGDGLNRLVRRSEDPDGFYFKRITTKNGLPNSSIYGILEDSDNKLWISTNLGIVNYVESTERLPSNSYRSLDGLSSDEFNTGAHFADNSGNLFFGSINGVTKVSPTEIIRNNQTRPLVFTKINIGERSVDVYDVNHSELPKVTQRTNESGIDISLANLSFDKLGTQRYRYRIKEIDERWKYLGTRRNVFIAALPEGEYTLEAQSQLVGQGWGEPVRKLDIVVEADFWKSAYAYYLMISLVVIVFMVGLAFVIRYYKNLLTIVNRKMDVEVLRLKELRLDSEVLRNSLFEREAELSSLQRKFQVADSKLDIEKYRDITTGFYRLNYFYKINKGNQQFDNHENAVALLSNYSAVALIEIAAFVDVQSTLGVLAANELLSKISITMRQKMHSNAQIFMVKSGTFMVLSDTANYQKFEDDVVNLKNLVARSQYDVANGLTRSTEVLISLISLSDVSIVDNEHAMNLIDSMIQWHQSLFTDNNASSYRFQLESKLIEIIKNKSEFETQRLIDDKLLVAITI